METQENIITPHAAAVGYLQMMQLTSALIDCMGQPTITKEMWSTALRVKAIAMQVETIYKDSMRKAGMSKAQVEEHMEAILDANSLLFRGLQALCMPDNIDDRIKMTAMLQAYLEGDVKEVEDEKRLG